jgi:hypothetical protein
MSSFEAALKDLIRAQERPPSDASGGGKKKYTESLSHLRPSVLSWQDGIDIAFAQVRDSDG